MQNVLPMYECDTCKQTTRQKLIYGLICPNCGSKSIHLYTPPAEEEAAPGSWWSRLLRRR
jgi:Zn finger protein HypA/HybF involved in hydrogenase expression